MVTRVGRAYRVILVTLVSLAGLVLAHQVIRVGLVYLDTAVTLVFLDGLV